MKRVGFITNSQFPHLTDSDSLVIELLKKREIEVESIIWSSPPPTLNQFDAIIMRSAWDYHTQYEKFTSFFHTLKNSGVPIYNPIDTMLWNSNKSYLLNLASQGVPIVPTIKIHSINEADWQKITQWPEIIIKPAVGASAFGITKLSSNNKNEVHKTIATLLKVGDVIIQPFMKEIYDGEISFIFFNKQFSHAVLKKPTLQDFRTQPEFGGTEKRTFPSDQMIGSASNILQKIKSPLLYTRLDAIVVNNNLQLMELELIEPHLFLDIAPEAASTFADAIARAI